MVHVAKKWIDLAFFSVVDLFARKVFELMQPPTGNLNCYPVC